MQFAIGGFGVSCVVVEELVIIHGLVKDVGKCEHMKLSAVLAHGRASKDVLVGNVDVGITMQAGLVSPQLVQDENTHAPGDCGILVSLEEL